MVLVSIVATMAVGAAVAAVFVTSGAYNMAADDEHSKPVYMVLETLRERSIEVRSKSIAAPDLDAPGMVASGAVMYDEMCAGCHLAPGSDHTEIRAGLYPQPPNLVEHGVHDPAEAFWIVKHGLKMSGMPAWGKSHDDDAIWNIVAFVRSAPTTTAKQYQRIVRQRGKETNESHQH